MLHTTVYDSMGEHRTWESMGEHGRASDLELGLAPTLSLGDCLDCFDCLDLHYSTPKGEPVSEERYN